MKSTHRGFTLTELLVVAGILVVLVGILTPVLSRSRAAARQAQCKSNLSQLAKAMTMYVGEHQLMYPVLAARPTLNPGMARLADTLAPYTGNAKLLRCPEDRQGFFEAEGSSYEWNPALNGQAQHTFVEDLAGPSKTPMLYDYENFHPDPGPGGWGGKNVAFCDGSVGH